MNQSIYNKNPLLKIVFIQRVARYSCRSHRQIVKLCYVTDKEWRTTILSYSLISLLRTLIGPSSFTFLEQRSRSHEIERFDASISESIDTMRQYHSPTNGLSLNHAWISQSTNIVQKLMNENVKQDDIASEELMRKIECFWRSQWKKFHRILSFVLRNVSEANMDIVIAYKQIIDYIVSPSYNVTSEFNELLHYRTSSSGTVISFVKELFAEKVLFGKQWIFAQWITENKHNPNLLEVFFPVKNYEKTFQRTQSVSPGERKPTAMQDPEQLHEMFWNLRNPHEVDFIDFLNATNFRSEFSFKRIKTFILDSFDSTRKFLSVCARHGRFDLIKKICGNFDDDVNDEQYYETFAGRRHRQEQQQQEQDSKKDPRFAFHHLHLFEKDPDVVTRFAHVKKDIEWTYTAQIWTTMHSVLVVAQKFNHHEIVRYVLVHFLKKRFSVDLMHQAIHRGVDTVHNHLQDKTEARKKQQDAIVKPGREPGSFSWEEIDFALNLRCGEHKGGATTLLKSNVLIDTFRRAIQSNQLELVEFFVEETDSLYFSHLGRDFYHHLVSLAILQRKNGNNVPGIRYPGTTQRAATPFLLSIESGSWEVFEYFLTKKDDGPLFIPLHETFADANNALPQRALRKSRRRENPLNFCCHVRNAAPSSIHVDRAPSSKSFSGDFNRISFEMAKKILECEIATSNNDDNQNSVLGVTGNQLLNDRSLGAYSFVPLHIATMYNCVDIARLLIYFGADTSIIEKDTTFVTGARYGSRLFAYARQKSNTKDRDLEFWQKRVLDVVDEAKQGPSPASNNVLYDMFQQTEEDEAEVKSRRIGFRKQIRQMAHVLYSD